MTNNFPKRKAHENLPATNLNFLLLPSSWVKLFKIVFLIALFKNRATLNVCIIVLYRFKQILINFFYSFVYKKEQFRNYR